MQVNEIILKESLYLDRVKNQSKPAIVTESFNHSYDIFGWIKPDGELIIPTKEQANSSKWFTHTDLLPYNDYDRPFREGYVRWVLERGTLYLENTKRTALELRECVESGLAKIEKLIQNPKNFNYFAGPAAIRANIQNKPLVILNYDMTAKAFNETTQSPKQLINIMSRGSSESDTLNEKFSPVLGYDAFGWVSPSGEIIMPTEEDAQYPLTITHAELLKGVKNRNAYIKWYLLNSTLTFSIWEKPSKALGKRIGNAARTIEKILENPDTFRHFIGLDARMNSRQNKPLIITEYCADIEGFYQVSSSVSELLGKIRTAANKREMVHEDAESFSTAKQIRGYFTQKYPGLTLDFYDSNNHDHATLSMIQVPKELQRQGIGAEVMKAITGYADKTGKTLTLTPERRSGGPGKDRLVSWYRKYGFVPNKGRYKDFRFSDSMIRVPATNIAESSSQDIISQIKQIGELYVNKYGASRDITNHGMALKKVLASPDLVKGQCYTVSMDFVRWARSNYPAMKYAVISGEASGSTTEEPSNHYAVKVNGKYVLDLTQHQFDQSSEPINVTSLNDFRKAYPKS